MNIEAANELKVLVTCVQNCTWPAAIWRL